MNKNDEAEIAAATLASLRREPDALRLIAEKLRITEMGPADHIRTKHEVRSYLDSGDTNFGRELVQRAMGRRVAQQATAENLAQQQRALQRQSTSP